MIYRIPFINDKFFQIFLELLHNLRRIFFPPLFLNKFLLFLLKFQVLLNNSFIQYNKQQCYFLGLNKLVSIKHTFHIIKLLLRNFFSYIFNLLPFWFYQIQNDFQIFINYVNDVRYDDVIHDYVLYHVNDLNDDVICDDHVNLQD